jgi:hypothetical protein
MISFFFLTVTFLPRHTQGTASMKYIFVRVGQYTKTVTDYIRPKCNFFILTFIENFFTNRPLKTFYPSVGHQGGWHRRWAGGRQY